MNGSAFGRRASRDAEAQEHRGDARARWIARTVRDLALPLVFVGGVLLATAEVSEAQEHRPSVAQSETQTQERSQPDVDDGGAPAQTSEEAEPTRSRSSRVPSVLPPSSLPERLAPRRLPEVETSLPLPKKPLPKKGDASPSSATERKAAEAVGGPVELRTPEDRFKARLGSQAVRGGGVFGRYDGVMASQALGEAARLNLVGGFPLAASNDARFDPNRSFYSVSLDLAPFDEKFAGRIFGVQQRIDAEQERRAVGGELRFEHARGFGLVTVDYDVDFRDVGMISMLASTQLDARTRLNAFADVRRYSKPQTAYAALQSPSVASVDQLLDKLSQTELRAPAFNRDVETRTVTLGASRQVTSAFQLAADVTLKDVILTSVTPSQPALGIASQVDSSLRATWKDLLIEQSSTTAALRVAEAADARRYSGSLGGQYPVWESFRVGPDLSLELSPDDERWTYKPAMRFEYLQKRLRLDFQLGLEIRDFDIGGAPADRTALFYKIGYRYDF